MTLFKTEHFSQLSDSTVYPSNKKHTSGHGALLHKNGLITIQDKPY